MGVVVTLKLSSMLAHKMWVQAVVFGHVGVWRRGLVKLVGEITNSALELPG